MDLVNVKCVFGCIHHALGHKLEESNGYVAATVVMQYIELIYINRTRIANILGYMIRMERACVLGKRPRP